MAVQLDANMALMEVDPGTKEIKATPYFEDYLFSLFLSAGGGAMTVEYVDVVQEQVTVSNVVIYTAPISANFESAHIIYANCVNEGGTNTELTLNIVQQGDSIAATNIYFPAKVILAGITDPLRVGNVIASSRLTVRPTGVPSTVVQNKSLLF